MFGITVNKNHLILCRSPKVTGSLSVWDLFLDFSPFLFTAGLKSLLQKSRYVTSNPLIQQFNIDLYMKRKSASSYFKAFVALFIYLFCPGTFVAIIYFMSEENISDADCKNSWCLTFVSSEESSVPLFPQTSMTP